MFGKKKLQTIDPVNLAEQQRLREQQEVNEAFVRALRFAGLYRTKLA